MFRQRARSDGQGRPSRADAGAVHPREPAQAWPPRRARRSWPGAGVGRPLHEGGCGAERTAQGTHGHHRSRTVSDRMEAPWAGRTTRSSLHSSCSVPYYPYPRGTPPLGPDLRHRQAASPGTARIQQYLQLTRLIENHGFRTPGPVGHDQRSTKALAAWALPKFLRKCGSTQDVRRRLVLAACRAVLDRASALQMLRPQRHCQSARCACGRLQAKPARWKRIHPPRAAFLEG